MYKDNLGFKIRASKREYATGIGLAAIFDDGKTISIAEPLTMKEHEENTFIREFAQLSNSAAQLLMDDLWQAGLRPSEGTGSAGSLKATEKHLEDMRKIVAEKLKVQL